VDGKKGSPTDSTSYTAQKLDSFDFGFMKEQEIIADSGNIIDDEDGSLRGGRLGVYCDSQEQIIYSALSYKCKSDVSEEVFAQLPFALQEKLAKK
jgi:hypothetical protein